MKARAQRTKMDTKKIKENTETNTGKSLIIVPPHSVWVYCSF